MGPERATLRPVKRVVEVELEKAGETLAVTYDRDALIRATAEGVPSAFLGERPVHEMLASVDALAEALVSWDLMYDDGRPYPTDREALSKLPIVALLKIERAISADALTPG